MNLDGRYNGPGMALPWVYMATFMVANTPWHRIAVHLDDEIVIVEFMDEAHYRRRRRKPTIH